MKKGNISIFVPHIGCPHKCSFCNQNTITGHETAPTAGDVEAAVRTALNQNDFEYEIAFFGGSFTAIDRQYMISLLESAYSFVQTSSRVTGIRISTRPDYIDDKILTLLKKYGVTSIELGAQSMNDDVLRMNMRGHTAENVRKASRLIKEYGFELGLQMMTGLYGSDDEKDLFTANEIIKFKPDTVRIYPTVVLDNTYLGSLYKAGRYIPNDVQKSVEICAKIVPLFNKNNIKVIRLGLHASDDVKNNMLAGGYHPSLGELVTSKIMLCEILSHKPGNYTVYINEKSISKLIGNKKCNLTELKEKGYTIDIEFDNKMNSNELKTEEKLWF